MALLDFLTSYNQLGTPSPSGLVNVVASGWAGSGTIITQQPSGYSFVVRGSGNSLASSGIDFASSGYYVPSGGFTNFNSSSGAFYGLPFDSGILRLVTSSSGMLTNNLLTFERPAPTNRGSTIATIFSNPSGTTYTYSSPVQNAPNVGGSGVQQGGGQQGGGQQGGGQTNTRRLPPGLILEN